MEIAVYTSSTCVFCHSLKHWLDKEGYEYVEKSVDDGGEALREMVELSGQRGTPFTAIRLEGSDTIEGVVGFDRLTIESIVKG